MDIYVAVTGLMLALASTNIFLVLAFVSYEFRRCFRGHG